MRQKEKRRRRALERMHNELVLAGWQLRESHGEFIWWAPQEPGKAYSGMSFSSKSIATRLAHRRLHEDR